MTGLFAEVAVVVPVLGTYYYRVPPGLRDQAAVGRQVVVPFGRRRLTGYILNLGEQPPPGLPGPIRAIDRVNTESPSFSPNHLEFYRWLGSYYLAPLGRVIESSLPRGASGSTRRRAFVTEAAQAVAAGGEPGQDEAAVLCLLRERPGLSLAQIRQHLPGRQVERLCQRLCRKGLIRWEDQLQEPRIKARFLQVVRACQVPAAAALEGGELKPKAVEMLRLLLERPRPLRELRQLLGNASYWVRKMAEQGLVRVGREEVYRDPAGLDIATAAPPPRLTQHQDEAVRRICQAVEQRRFAAFLLHGVTGSGKTEVYLAAIAAAMHSGRQSLVLVPEIALTAQMEALFRQRFGPRLAILHSALSGGERRDEWLRVRRGEAEVVLGARSAVFAPLDRLGLVVVDEEHDSSYKQESGLSYHGRDAAVMRAKLEEAVVVLGSATPALSSFHNALQGKFQLLTLPQRIDHRPLPQVRIIDMRLQPQGQVISAPLHQALRDTLRAGKQALLLIDRRGYASFFLCRRCGFTLRCHNCAVTVTWHKSSAELRCHLCGLSLPVPSRCPRCEAASLRPFGFGTQRVESEVKRLFPEARVGRMDRDTTRNRQAYGGLLRALSCGHTDVLVGTKMIAKGHDFPNITLVGVVSADVALQWPDFRAAENTFQLLTQVAGRAGRGQSPGLVLVQTYNPEHYSIGFARKHDYLGFFKEEMLFRRQLGYPPYWRLVLFLLAGNVEEKTRQAAERLAARCQQLRQQQPGLQAELEVLGPVAAPLSRIKGKYRWQLLLKGKRSAHLLELGRELMAWGQGTLRGSGVSLSVIVDPMSLI